MHVYNPLIAGATPFEARLSEVVDIGPVYQYIRIIQEQVHSAVARLV